MIALIQLLELLSKVFFFLGYLHNAETYPPKLSADEERHLVSLMEKGDENAKQKLIMHNMRLVAHVAKKYSTCSIDQEDLLSIGTIGLIKGVNTFDSKKAPRIAGYIAKCIDNEILMAIRSEQKLSANVSLEDFIGTDDEGSGISLMDVLAVEDEDVAYRLDLASQTAKLYSLIDSALDDRERAIIKLRYGLNPRGRRYTQIEVSKILSISRSYVSRIEKKALGKLAEGMTDEQR
ncbi:MAG: RNA polymerase sporulation sigma factor SigK [Eubacteriaceae bacterium]|nr:RNA polymerase sporulation sigma factor SigK [Eubacteriaceae bacterium]